MRVVLTLCVAVVGVAHAPAQDSAKLLERAKIGVDPASLTKALQARTPSDDVYRELQAHAEAIVRGDASKQEAAKTALSAAREPARAVVRTLLERTLEGDGRRRLEAVRATLERGAVSTETLLALVAEAAKHAATADALIGFLPYAPDELVEEALVAAVGRVATPGDVRKRVETGAGLPERSAALIYVAGRHFGPTERAWVLARASDADPVVRRRVREALAGPNVVAALGEAKSADLETLKSYHVDPAEKSLLAFFHGRVRTPEEIASIDGWLRDLAHVDYRVRDRAATLLVRQGAIALPFLAKVEESEHVEASRRAYRCSQEIRNGPGPELPIAAARRLSEATKPADAIAALLAFAPFAEQASVSDEVHAALTLLAIDVGDVARAEFRRALTDGQPARRAAAVYVLGHLGGPDVVADVRKALDDPDAAVRMRATQASLALLEPDAPAALVARLIDAPAGLLSNVEELLLRLGRGEGPTNASVDTSPAARAKLHAAWIAAFRKRPADPRDLRRADTYQGIVTIAEYDTSVPGRGNGKVWQRARDGRVRWVQTDFLGAMHAQSLPNGNLLVAENSANRVVERSPAGSVVWEHRAQNGNPIAVQRLPNGNTFVATYNHVAEVTPDHKSVYSYNKGPAFYLFSAEKTRDGRIVCMTAQGNIIVLDATDGKELKNFRAIQGGGWCSAQALPNGRFLVASMGVGGGKVLEIDDAAKVHWEKSVPGAFRAIRLPNGNVLVASMTTRKVQEIDRDGAIRWEVVCDGRPWGLQAK